MPQDICNPEQVGSLAREIQAALDVVDAYQAQLRRRTATLDQQAEGLTRRLRAEGLDTPEAIERVYACLDEQARAAAANGRTDARRASRMV